MSGQKFGELPPHWAADALESVIESNDASKVARAMGDAIASNPRVIKAIQDALDNESPPGQCGPGPAHRVRVAVATVMGEYV